MNGNRISKTVGMFIGNFGRKDKKCRYSLKSMTGQGKDFFFFFLVSRLMNHRSMINPEAASRERD